MSQVSATQLPRGVRLALDWGQRRIGVAACDPAGTLAFPVATLDAADPWPRLADIIAEYQPTALVLGYPVNLSGQPGLAAQRIEAVVPQLTARLGLEVWLVDERLTSATAARLLSQVGLDTRRQRPVIDQAASVALLETVLAAERAGQEIGQRPGTTEEN